jgi:hypothetical protein
MGATEKAHSTGNGIVESAAAFGLAETGFTLSLISVP